MNALLQRIRMMRSAGIALALVLSLLIHTVLLFGPTLIQLTPVEPVLPPLIARLEPLPVIKLAPHHKPHVRAKSKHAAPKPPPPPEVASPPEAAPSTESPSVDAQPGEAVSPPAEQAAVPAGEVKPAHPLPRHAQLTFNAYKGTSFKIGEARHRLDVGDDNNYTLQIGMNTTGIAKFFKTFELSQQSKGQVSALGLRPDEFSENKVTAKGKQALTASFDWNNRQLSFSAGNSIALPAGAQDILSVLYQFSQMDLTQASLMMHVSNGRKLENYQLEAGSEEAIDTPLGTLRALPLRKIHAPGEEGFEIWLGLEYRLLPVMIRQIDRNGEIAGELVISDIRVSEE